jgi:hypothetical protein
LRCQRFRGKGRLRVEDGKLILEMGTMTGVPIPTMLPTMNYEIALRQCALMAVTFSAASTFPWAKIPAV